MNFWREQQSKLNANSTNASSTKDSKDNTSIRGKIQRNSTLTRPPSATVSGITMSITPSTKLEPARPIHFPPSPSPSSTSPLLTSPPPSSASAKPASPSPSLPEDITDDQETEPGHKRR